MQVHIPVGSEGEFVAARLKSIVDRVERLEEEKSAIGVDIKDIFTEAKSAGFDVKVLRHVIRLRKKSDNERDEEETLLALYKSALGM